ncbi:LPXTG-domain-containing protein cell wall anchor domain, partial [Parascardovia denticolens F0305]
AAGGPRLAQTGVDASRATLVGLILAGLAVGLLLVRRRMAAGRG